ncbi:tail fiber assembly protein [Xenorhabdus sp. KJ12.1]|uniref:tail fiber assembly protein n=1 Tax=Xenorhabdus sp. KJ12.1 TaxID=1851571 RepID=UPI000C048AC5|nr:tail fiber assembly protein [Xenorhabdus sp. KJ12.1]PHM72684.1 tail assembly chaperone [Xenorhabdus sp. KJ12.1]
MNQYYYSPEANGFYQRDVHTDMPSDVVEITDDEYLILMGAASTGREIKAGKHGRPVIVEPVLDHIAIAEAQKQALLIAINQKTQAWQTQLMLGMITEEDKLTLTQWMRYSQKVQLVDCSTAPDIAWPEQPE